MSFSSPPSFKPAAAKLKRRLKALPQPKASKAKQSGPERRRRRSGRVKGSHPVSRSAECDLLCPAQRDLHSYPTVFRREIQPQLFWSQCEQEEEEDDEDDDGGLYALTYPTHPFSERWLQCTQHLVMVGVCGGVGRRLFLLTLPSTVPPSPRPFPLPTSSLPFAL